MLWERTLVADRHQIVGRPSTAVGISTEGKMGEEISDHQGQDHLAELDKRAHISQNLHGQRRSARVCRGAEASRR